MSLLEAGFGQRLLISGVYPAATRQELAALNGGSDATWECCVDLDREAETTSGNAEQAALWAAQNEYESLIVVTADFHMPRSLIEFGHAMPELTLHAHPVHTSASAWAGLRDLTLVRRAASEWMKWRITQIRRGRFS